MPQAPALPAENSRTLENMKAAQSAVDGFLMSVNDYQQCLLGCITDINLHIVDISQSAEAVVASWKQTVDDYQRHQ